jgi:hypothetical protein
MKKQSMKPEWGWMGIAVCAALLIGAQGAYGAAAASDWDAIETLGSVTYATASDGSITVEFGAASGADRRTALIGADFGGAVGSDLSGVAKIAFRVVGAGPVPHWAAVTIQGKRTWMRTFAVSPVDGEVGLVEILVNKNDGWFWSGDPSLDTQAKWDEDLANVSFIAIRLDQKDTIPQSYGISGFSLLTSAGETIPATLSAFQGDLWAAFRVQNAEALTEAQLAADSDSDGATDLEEVTFGGNPIVEVVSSDASGTTIKFACAEGGAYSVYRDNDLSDDVDYTLVGTVAPDAAQVQAGQLEHLDTDASDGGPYFYKVVANRE